MKNLTSRGCLCMTRSALFVVLPLACSMLAAVAASQSQQHQKYYELLDKIGPYRESLISASVLSDKQRWYAQSYLVPTTPEEVKKFLGDLAAIEALMSGPYKDVEAPEPYRKDNILLFPSEWLKIAQSRSDIVAEVSGGAAAAKADYEVKFINDITAKIKQSDGWGLNENGLKLVLGKREEVRKALCAGEKFPGWDEACDELVKTARGLASSNRAYAPHSNSFVTDLIKAGWAKNYPDRKILRIGTAKSQWTIVKDSLGRPKYRSMGAAVRYTVPGFDLVIEQTVSILQDYAGNGQYKYRPTAQIPDYRIVKK